MRGGLLGQAESQGFTLSVRKSQASAGIASINCRLGHIDPVASGKAEQGRHGNVIINTCEPGMGIVVPLIIRLGITGEPPLSAWGTRTLEASFSTVSSPVPWIL